jgi:hypothetical protein
MVLGHFVARIEFSSHTRQLSSTANSWETGKRIHWTLRKVKSHSKKKRKHAGRKAMAVSVMNLRCLGTMTNLFIANASAVVVHKTSLVDMFKKILCSGISRQIM